MRRAGLHFGAAILGLWCAGWIQYFSGTTLYAGIRNPPTAYALLFVVIGLALVAVSHDRFLRAAWCVFAIAQLLNVAAPVLPSWLVAWATNVLTGLFAVLLVIAGARRRPTRVLVIAIAIFVAAVVLRIAATTYAKRLHSGNSVIGRVFRYDLPNDLTILGATQPIRAART